MATYSFVSASFLGGTLILFIGSLHFSFPFVSLYFFRTRLGWKRSLWILPFLWPAWEWSFLQSRFSVPFPTFHVTQAPLTWLVQFVDVFGSSAISFWLLLLNVLIVRAIEDWHTARTDLKASRSSRARTWNQKYQALFLLRRLAFVTLLMFLPPLLYSAYVFSSSPAEAQKKITVSLVQPNIDPETKWTDSTRATVVAKTITMTDSLISSSTPDLIVWPETAVPYPILHHDDVRDFVFGAVLDWNTPLLTGTVDMDVYEVTSRIPPLPKYLNRNYELYNSVLMVTPQLAWRSRQPGFSSLKIKTYRKKNLMPFTEAVPYAEKYPFLSSLTLDFGGGTNWSAGQSAGTLLFASSNGDRVRVGPIICWDLLYGSTTAESARNGAKFLAAVTNEGWWGKSITAHEIESFTRLRSIETRRSIAKCSNTGYTFFTDPYGRVYGKVRWWEEQIATAGVTLSQEASIYMRYTDYFPRACLFVVGIGLFITLIANHIKPLYLGNA